MEWLNYHHLFYFWRVAVLGSVSAAAKELRLRQPTISAQVSALEATLGKKLFEREARRLSLTEEGQIAFRYAEEIFQTGRELLDVMSERPIGRPLQCAVGVADAVPKLIAHKLLEPVFKSSDPVRLQCHEDHASALLGLLAAHKLDLVISDSPIPSDLNIKGFNHLMGETKIGFFASHDLALKLRKGFPNSLEGQNLLLPLPTAAIRRPLDQWLDENNIRPVIAGEFDDSALMKIFGEAGRGVFPASMAIAKDIERRHRVKLIAEAPELVERFYAISLARRIKNPIIDSIVLKGRKILEGVG